MPSPRLFLFSLVALLLLALPAMAFFAGPMPGWERGGTYDKLYDAKAYETLKGKLVEYAEVTPLPGMAKGLGLTILTKKGQEVQVHLGPHRYLDFLPDIIKPGDKIKVKGAFANVGGARAFMAAKIRRGEVFELKLRSTKTGAPYWDLDASGIFEESLEQ